MRHDLMMNTARDTLTIRNNPSQEALPMRRLGSFLPGEGVGGSGVHWSGHTWRWTDMEFKVRSMYEERYGKNFIPADMTIQDWGITYDELEPYYDKFEYIGRRSPARPATSRARSSRAAIRSRRRARANIRCRRCTPILASADVRRGRDEARLSSVPAADRERLARLHQSRRLEARRLPVLRLLPALRLRGERQGQPAHHRHPDRDAQSELRAAHALLGHQGAQGLDRQEGRPASPTPTCSTARSSSSPPSIVLLCAYAINNVHLMLLSGIGKPYDPAAQTGVIGKNYCYQTGAGATLFFEGRHFNPFMNAGGSNTTIDDFNINWDFDRGPHGFVGGYTRRRGLQHRAADRLPAGAARHAAMGLGWKARDREVVPDRDEHQRQRQRDGEPLQLSRSRPDLHATRSASR